MDSFIQKNLFACPHSFAELWPIFEMRLGKRMEANE